MKAILALLLLLIPFTVHAEPSPTIKELMDEPVSMFDFGLYQWRDYLRQNANEDDEIHVGYLLHDNKIVIHAMIVSEKNNPIEMCKFHTRLIKFSAPQVGYFFCNRGYDKKCQSTAYRENVAEEIKKITYIDVEIFRSRMERLDLKPSAHSICSFNKEDYLFTDK